MADLGEDRGHQALHHGHDGVAVREGQLQIQLRELRLPVRPQILRTSREHVAV